MNWLVLAPENMDLNELSSALRNLGDDVEVKSDKIPIGDTEYSLEVSGADDLDQKIDALNMPITVYPNSGFELY
jgi:hypothetical protein